MARAPYLAPAAIDPADQDMVGAHVAGLGRAGLDDRGIHDLDEVRARKSWVMHRS